MAISGLIGLMQFQRRGVYLVSPVNPANWPISYVAAIICDGDAWGGPWPRAFDANPYMSVVSPVLVQVNPPPPTFAFLSHSPVGQTRVLPKGWYGETYTPIIAPNIPIPTVPAGDSIGNFGFDGPIGFSYE